MFANCYRLSLLSPVVLFVLISLVACSAPSAGDDEWTTQSTPATTNHEDLPESKQTPQQMYLTAKQAYHVVESKPSDVLFLDVRSPAELVLVGAPTNIDANIPYVLPQWNEWNEKGNGFKWTRNDRFVADVEEALGKRNLTKESKVIIVCRSGSRSAQAAKTLHEAGFNNVFTVVDGFEGDKVKSGEQAGQRVINGWKNSNLPWTYKLDKEKAYLPDEEPR